MSDRRPIVLSIAGHDPTGGAGIHADIETIRSMGCHVCSIITTITVQNTANVLKIKPIELDLIKHQLQVLSEDIRFDVIKIGLLGAASTARLVAQYLNQNDTNQVVVDPVLAAGGGALLAKPELINVIYQEIFPLTTVATPNSLEARQFAPESDDLGRCAEIILSSGCQYVLVTGTHEPDDDVVNQLYDRSGLLQSYHWPRLSPEYHGSGCTLSAAIAAQLAHGKTISEAIVSAQHYTWNSLASGYQPGKHQHVPNRNPCID